TRDQRHQLILLTPERLPRHQPPHWAWLNESATAPGDSLSIDFRGQLAPRRYLSSMSALSERHIAVRTEYLRCPILLLLFRLHWNSALGCCQAPAPSCACVNGGRSHFHWLRRAVRPG